MSGVFRFEIPFLAYLLTLLYFPAIQNRFFRIVFPTVPIITGYLLFDFFYSSFKRGPRISDLDNLPTLIDTYTVMGLGVIFCFLLIILSCLFLVWKNYLSASKNRYVQLSFKVFLLLIGSIFVFSNTFVEYLEKAYSQFEVSIGGSIKDNGRFASLFYDRHDEKIKRALLKEYNSKPINIAQILYPGYVVKKRNIHIIVLESFIDPTLVRKIVFSKSPLASELKPFLQDGKYFSLVKSPVYGGLSAQAEFELLSGVKAFSAIGSIDFNVMKGNPASSFINRLKSNGYDSIATIATSSYYFNSQDAYRSLGLDNVVFLGDTSSNFEKQPGDTFVFDGDVFTYHLDKIKESLKNTNKNIVSYCLGLYGHTPFPRNYEVRPDLIELSIDNQEFKNMTNQFYYRTKALGIFLEELTTIDPDSIIYVTSDHLPLIMNEQVNYDSDIYSNISLLLDRGKFVDVSGKNYYEIPQFLWSLLTQNEMKIISAEEMESIYYKLLSESLGQ